MLVTFQGAAKAAPDDGSVLPSRPRLRPAWPRPGCKIPNTSGAWSRTICPRTRRIFSLSSLDDVGFGLPDTYGGPIHTPTLSRIAEEGISYNAFHTTAICSPTRAALLTGRNHQRVGSGTIAERAVDWDGYTGVIPKTSASWRKCWAITATRPPPSANGTTPRRPKPRRWGRSRCGRRRGHRLRLFLWLPGRRDFAMGAAPVRELQCHRAAHDREIPSQRRSGRQGHHLDAQHRAYAPDKPFFMYWAPGAGHGPHHIFKEWADKYKGQFDNGWDALRERVFKRQKDLGWIPADTQLTPRAESMAAWDSIPEAERPFQRRLMEVFAGFVEHVDTQAGKVVDGLERLGIRDNTIVIYIFGDNGSSAEGQNGTISELLAQNGIPSTVEQQIEALEQLGGLDALGGPKVDNMYHAGWAWAGDTPFQYTKLIASHFGGTRNPMAISWPARIKPDKTPRPQFHHVNDIAPTHLRDLDIKPPKVVDGFKQDPIDGVSMVYTSPTPCAGHKQTQYFDNNGSRGIYQDGWFACTFGPLTPWLTVSSGAGNVGFGKDVWELYNLTTDFSQVDNLGRKGPEAARAMKGGISERSQGQQSLPDRRGHLAAHPSRRPCHDALHKAGSSTDNHPHARIRRARPGPRKQPRHHRCGTGENASGVLYALGGASGGLALYMDKGELVYEYNMMIIERTSAFEGQTGGRQAQDRSRHHHCQPRRAGDVILKVDGNGGRPNERQAHRPGAPSPRAKLDVGVDLGSPVSMDYFDRGRFAFNGKINSVTVELK